jgi:regulatory protein
MTLFLKSSKHQISIVSVENKLNHLHLLVDGNVYAVVHTDIFPKTIRFPIFNSLDQLREYFSELECQQAKKFALKKLSRRSYPSPELRQLLTDRLVSSHNIEKIITMCQQLGYLHDENWKTHFIEQQKRKGVGPKLIRDKLRRKGLNTTQVSNDQQPLILKLLETRYRLRNLKNVKERHKVIASLIRRGFDLAIIQECLKKLTNQT